MPPVWDQGELCSCTAHALAAAFGFEHRKIEMSRLQLYYLGRAYENKIHQDGGARISNVIKALRDTGVARERHWPYDPSKVFEQPKPLARQMARRHKISRYATLKGGDEFRGCLNLGFPFVVGIHHTDRFWSQASRDTGVVELPGPDELTPHAHAVCVIGYAQPCARAQRYLNADGGLYYEVRNSAGPAWGDDGHFWIPAAYLENPKLAGDAWTIRR
jgi:C1A family cysteine protease